MALVKIIDPKTKKAVEYYLDTRLKENLDKKIIPSLHKKDKDCFIAVDGKEGSGKSTFALQIAKYVDPSFNLTRVVFSADEFREAIFKAHKGQAIVYDEAFTGFSSRTSLSKVNNVLVSLTMQMRQKNLFVIIVLPTYFLLDKYIALFRTKALIHVFESKGVRGYFRLYNSKLKLRLYLAGSKTYSYNTKLVKTRFKGRFYGKFALGDAQTEKLYRKKKEESLNATESNPMTAGQVKYKEQRDLVIWLLRKKLELNYRQLEDYLLEYGIDISFQQLSKICGKFGDIEPESTKKELKTTENDEKVEKVALNEENPDTNDEIGLNDAENDDIDAEIDEIEPKLPILDEDDAEFDGDDEKTDGI